MKEWQEGYVQSNGIRVHYYRTGGDLHQLVLNHGAMDDGLCWTRVARALETDYDLIMLDARGHGKSDSGEGDYSTESRTADLIGVIEALGLENPVVGGHSMGAVTSLSAAVLRPDLVAGVFMEDPSISLPGEAFFGGETSKLNELLYKGMLRLLKRSRNFPKSLSKPLVKRLLPDSPPEDIEPWLNSKQMVSADFVDAIEDPRWLFGGFDFDLLDKANFPAMLIYGDRNAGAILTHESAQELEKRISGLQVVHFPGASHDIRRIRFDGYLEALRRFMLDVNGE